MPYFAEIKSRSGKVLDPKEDDSLGFKSLQDLALVTDVLGY